MAEALKISVLRKSQPVDLEIEEGMVARYYVKEMTGAQRDEYFNKTSQVAKTDASGTVVGVKDYKGLYSSLLAFCMYDSDQKTIPEAKIQEWPDTAQKALFEVALTINGMNTREGTEKN